MTSVFFAVCFSSQPIQIETYLLFLTVYNMGEARDELVEGHAWIIPLGPGGG